MLPSTDAGGVHEAPQASAEHTPTKELATEAIPVPQGEHLETHTVATTAHGSVTVVATESDQAQQAGADGAERSAAGSLRIDGTPGVPGRVAEADRGPARTDDHGADVAQPAAVEPAAERPPLEAAPATRRAEAPETHAGTTPAPATSGGWAARPVCRGARLRGRPYRFLDPVTLRRTT